MLAKNTPVGNMALSRRIVEEAWNQHQPQALERFYSSEYVNHKPSGGVTPDLEGLRQWITACVNGFPDLHLTIEDMIAEGDKVVTRWVARGTHQGLFMGVAPSGRQVSIYGITIARCAGGEDTFLFKSGKVWRVECEALYYRGRVFGLFNEKAPAQVSLHQLALL